MQWVKLTRIFAPDQNYDWMYSHAANPFAIHLIDDIFRVYFTCRDINNRSYIGFVDIDFSNSFRVINISDNPVVSPGELGMFDDSGTAMGYYLKVGAKSFLYYLGWNLKVTVPWLNTIGLAIFNEEKKCFEKYSRAPLIDRSNEDPFSISYPSVLYDNGIYKMWYGSNLSWGSTQDQMEHVIKYAESNNAIDWKRNDKVVVGLQYKNEYAISKPFVLKTESGFEMWYSFRGNGSIMTYRIGYAISYDGINWTRRDKEAGIDVSKTGWDSEMICYPFIMNHKNQKFMIYNGNGYGKTGFGIAVLDE
jgi:hypothetical protein